MCGIVGLLNTDGRPVTSIELKKMTDSISHRGPDGEGHWIERNIGIGHRRLAIIDLTSAGKQPMVCPNNRYVLSYNGEIYNFLELRKELETLGCSFRSQSDSEIVLNSFAHWGTNCLQKFNGMFAFVIWDRKEKILTLARDRYGIKPLYYSKQGNTFFFCSEQKAITVLSQFNRKLNHPGLLEYFTFQNFFTDQTLLKDIYLLEAGNFIEFDSKKNIFQKSQYWDFKFEEPKKPANKREYIEELERLFCKAVNRQMVSDVELGSYLSGGIDSGSIAAIAAAEINNLKTFTCGFDLSSASGIELSFDERAQAEYMSALFKTEHYQMVLKAGDMERCLSELAWHLEEPRVGQSYPNYYAAKLASRFVKVVLSGTGGDELFGGYPWRYYRVVKCKNFEDYIDQYYLYWQRLIDNSYLKRMFSGISKEIENVWTRDIFRDVLKGQNFELGRPEDYINHSLYFEAKTFLHGLFVVEDKLSMAHSLESRVPFMDNDLVDFAMSCPISLKLNNLYKVMDVNENDPGNKQVTYFKKTNDGKIVLREMITNYIPEKIAKAKKQGFSSPDASWFKGESINFVRDKLINSNAFIYNFMDKKSVHNLINEHLEGKKNRRLLIWSLLNTETYLSQLFN